MPTIYLTLLTKQPKILRQILTTYAVKPPEIVVKTTKDRADPRYNLSFDQWKKLMETPYYKERDKTP